MTAQQLNLSTGSSKKITVAIYSIGDLEKLSGIKAHTIRMWEQRYGIVVPRRTDTNIRYYEDSDLKLLLNIALLNKNGIKISKIAKMSKEAIAQKVAAISEVNFEYDTQLDALTISMIEMDEYKFDRIISTNIRQIGFEKTMLEVIYPFLEKLSLLWMTGSIQPIQEHFISNLIRQKLIVAIDQEPFPRGSKVKKFVVYLPEGETQELSLLFMHYLLKSRNHQVIYLGQNISMFDLKDTCKIHKPDYVFTLITETFIQRSIQEYIDELAEYIQPAHMLLSGYQVVVQRVNSTDTVSVFGSLDETIEFLERLP